MDVVLASAEKEKKRKYSEAVEAHHASFTPFMTSVDGVLGHEVVIHVYFLSRLVDQLSPRFLYSNNNLYTYMYL